MSPERAPIPASAPAPALARGEGLPAGGPTVVLGVGNILYGDEGVGVLAAHALARCFRFTPAVEVLDGATLGFDMIDLFTTRSSIIVLDALAADARPGSIFRLPSALLRQLGPEVRPTAHEVDPLHLLKMAPLFGDPPELVLLGIVPATTACTVGLSPALASAFGAFVQAALTELAAQGVRAEPVAPVVLDDVVDALVHGVR